MKLRVPDYYDEFQCIADKCSDNCCIGGWEIDIDEDTYERYQQMSGETGEKLRSSIIQTEDGDYCFRAYRWQMSNAYRRRLVCRT